MSICKVRFTFAASNQLKFQTMNKNYLFPHRFKAIGWVITGITLAATIADFVASRCYDWHPHLKMPALFDDDPLGFLSDEGKNPGLFKMADCSIFTFILIFMTIGLILVGFSREKVEDEFVRQLRERSLVWATLVSAAVFLFGTLTIYGMVYAYFAYSIYFIFLLLFIIKFNVSLHRFGKGGENEE